MKPRLEAQTALAAFVFSFFRAVERMIPSAWVEKYIRLPSEKTETEPGPVSFKTRKFLRGPLDDLADPEVHTIVWVGPTRMGKTFLLRMALCYVVAVLRLPVLWYDSTINKARSVSQKEIQPLIYHNRVLSERLPVDRHHVTNTKILFPGAPFEMFGANSVAQAAGETAAVVLGNECDKWQDKSEKEASIIDLVKHRTESFDDLRKHFLSSTPTLEEMSIWQEFLQGDQRKFFVKCSRCGHEQTLEWSGVKWDPAARKGKGAWDHRRVRETARYECANEDCHHHHDQAALRAMVALGKWKPTAEGQPGVRSYHINGLYGPLKVNEMGELAVAFLSARRAGFYTDRQDFWNSRMGLPWVDDISVLTAKKFAEFELDYMRGEIPRNLPGETEEFKPDIVIVEADVQTWGIPFVVEGFRWDGHCCTIDHGIAGSFRDLKDIQAAYHKKQYASKSYVIIDISFAERRTETLEAILKNARRGWIGAEGQEILKDKVKKEFANVWIGGEKQARGVRVPKLLISTYHFKVELEKKYSGEIRNWHTYQLPPLAPTDTEVEEQANFYTQLLDERRRPRKRRTVGKPKDEFVSKNKNNHMGDCKVYGLGLFFFLSKSQAHTAKSGRREVKVKKT